MEEPRAPLTRRLTFAQLVGFDVALGLLLALVLVGAGATRQPGRLHSGVPIGAGIALVCVACACVAVRRWWPLTTLEIALAAQATTVYLGFSADPMLAVAAVLYIVALVKPTRTAVIALIAVGAALCVLLLITSVAAPGAEHASTTFGRATGAAIVQVAAWAAGRAARAARAYAEGLREQAERRAQAKVDQARGAVAEERLRIARELHDVVAHSMSVIAVQAGVGRYVIDSRPAEAAQALTAIEATSRTALREMRQLLGLLRDGAPGEMLSAPGLANIHDLARHTGLRVDLTVHGTPRQLPAGVDVAAFRIVQEALTNVVKHAGTDHSRVVVDYSSDAVAIEVSDNGTGAASTGEGGHGLIGMRERATLYGGEFSAGPLPGGGYRVSARLPAGDAA